MYQGGMPPMEHLRSALDADDEEELGKIYDPQVIKRLPAYLRPIKSWITLGAIGMVVRTLASLASPYLVAITIDSFIKTGNFSGLNVIVIVLIAASLMVWGGQYLETLYLSYAADIILYRLRTQMFDHLQKLSLSFFDHNQVGKLMSRVQNDVGQLQELITSGALNIIISALTLVGIAIVMVIMDLNLALLTLTVVPVLAIIIIVWQRHARRAFTRVRRAIAEVNAQLQESISGVRVIQSLTRENMNLRQFDAVNRGHLDANIEAARLTSVMMPVVEILTAVATGLVIVFGGYRVLDGQMGIGVLLGFLLYVQRFFNPVLELTMEYTELQRAMVSGARIFELLDIEPAIKDNPKAAELPPVKGEVQFRHVSFGYTPEVEILHDIDFSVSPGETVALVGRTGAGKSSLASLVARFYEATKGQVTIDGFDVASVTQQSLRRQIGIVPQDPFLFSGSIADNIKYGHIEASHDEMFRAAQTVGAHEFITHLEHGYDTPVGERGVNLSTGQRQLICLARAILSNPPILILDEATSNVDTNTERFMQKALRATMKGRTCLVIAHRLSTIADADRIIVLEHGKIVETGSHQELLAKQGLYYHMLETLKGETAEPASKKEA